ncbi:hypothetical protein [Parageobacillus galactosidasius]|uniref:Uncharacterized protein n=1 Tax=Parageobacillus galactosidasius TaxID=883812 RepID=A0A226QRP6_9BACL|nr:hypothetical protein [Parageobacillus galactosidasius]OXB94704.1 hypothetical protein B9L23_07510 [Parageobacillus galactosidasius]
MELIEVYIKKKKIKQIENKNRRIYKKIIKETFFNKDPYEETFFNKDPYIDQERFIINWDTNKNIINITNKNGFN